MYKHQKPIPPSPPIKQFPFLSTAASLIESLLRSKKQKNSKQAFDKLHRNSLSVQKRSSLFFKILSKLTAKKDFTNKKFVFGVLYQLKISDILAKKQRVTQLKEKCRQNSTIQFINIVNRNLKLKISQTFSELKAKTSLIKQRNAFKILNLMNSIKFIEQKLLRNSFKLIKVQGFNLLAKYKRCFVVERFYARKRLELLTFALGQLRNKPAKLPQKPTQTNPPSSQKQQADLLKQLQEQKKFLQAELNQLKLINRSNLKTKQTELQKMQSQYQSLRFSFDLMGQENSELTETIKQRQRLTLEAEKKKKQQEQTLTIKRFTQPHFSTRFNQQEMWKSIFDNLLFYLYKVNSGYNNQLFSFDIMIEHMTQPLISLSIYSEKAQLQEENQVLKDLFDSYKAAFNKTPSSDALKKGAVYPLEILNKERKYLYLALESLSRWGTTEAQGLEEIRTVLENFKNNKEQDVVSLGADN